MEVVNIESYRQRLADETPEPKTITFRSPKFDQDDGASKSVNIHVTVDNGDALGILDVVIEQGGIGEVYDDGVYYFIPWPCACVEIS